MRQTIFAFTGAILLTLCFYGCAKTVNEKWMTYSETACYPFWVNESSDKKTRSTLETFLKSDGIIPLKIKIEGNRGSYCEGCDCKTGKIYRVQVDKSQVGALAYWGFELE